MPDKGHSNGSKFCDQEKVVWHSNSVISFTNSNANRMQKTPVNSLKQKGASFTDYGFTKRCSMTWEKGS